MKPPRLTRKAKTLATTPTKCIMHSPNSNAVKEEPMRLRLILLTILLTATGCAVQHEYYRKEFTIEIREENFATPSPSIHATFKIYN